MGEVLLTEVRDYWKTVSEAVKTAGGNAGTEGIQVAGTDGAKTRVIKTTATGEQIVQVTNSLPAGTNKLGKVDVDTSALPTGAATAAKQDTLIAKDFATQTTLATILAKLIAAPATEAKQTALAGLIGEVQVNPTTNTLLARLKALETKIDGLSGKVDAITNGTTPAITQLKGSIPEYNWFASDDRPIPKDSEEPAIGVEVDAETGNITGLFWSGEIWKEV